MWKARNDMEHGTTHDAQISYATERMDSQLTEVYKENTQYPLQQESSYLEYRSGEESNVNSGQTNVGWIWYVQQ